jgi:hypothetical protein
VGTGAPEIAAQAEGMLGHVEHAAGNVDASREWFTRSLETFRSLGTAWGIGHGLYGLARAAIAAGDVAAAEGLLAGAAAELRDAGPWFMSLTRNVRALVAVRGGDADRAIGWVHDNLAAVRDLGDKFVFVYALVPLSVAAALKGDDAWVARIVGLRDALMESTGAVVIVDQSTHALRESGERVARARLGAEGWAAAYAAGRRGSLDGLMRDVEAALGAPAAAG